MNLLEAKEILKKKGYTVRRLNECGSSSCGSSFSSRVNGCSGYNGDDYTKSSNFSYNNDNTDFDMDKIYKTAYAKQNALTQMDNIFKNLSDAKKLAVFKELKKYIPGADVMEIFDFMKNLG